MKLVAVNAGYEPREVPLREGVNVTLGRCPSSKSPQSARISFLGSSTQEKKILALSRNHCTLAHENGKWHVLDEGSNNGVYVDGAQLDKYARSKPLRHGAEIKLSKMNDPAVAFRFESWVEPPAVQQQQEQNKVDVLREILECASCRSLLRLPVACLPCGHCFCAVCVKSSICLLCQTHKADDKGIAFRCTPLDQILTRLFQSTVTVNSNNDNLFVRVKEETELELVAVAKPAKQQRMEEEEEVKVCAFCAEPEHEPGMKCPHRKDSDEEESDLEDYV